MNQNICLCYHPTTTVLVDDNQDFLQVIKMELEQSLCCQAYIDPGKALHFFKHEYALKPFTQRCFMTSPEERLDHLFFNLNLRLIHKEIEAVKRFNEVAVVVLDYTMPRMNGLSLARELKALAPNLQLILLTGEADHELAVQAFNEGIIDKFIKKSTPDLSHVLLEAIKALEHKYFVNLSQTIFDKLNGSSDKLLRLHNPIFCQFFAELCVQHQAVEYYLVDSSGSFVLINKYGEPTWLAVLTHDELIEFYQFALLEKAPVNVLEALQQKSKLPFFYSEQDLTIPPRDWLQYLHAAEQLHGTDFYYALSSNKALYNWHEHNLTSYQEFMAEQV
jgi:CheY-like chemotaxis protein